MSLTLVLFFFECYRYLILDWQNGFHLSGLTIQSLRLKEHLGRVSRTQFYSIGGMIIVAMYCYWNLKRCILFCRHLAPEYYTHGIVDEKTDVFAFGVFLLEIISGRKPVDNSHQSIHIWVRNLPFIYSIKWFSSSLSHPIIIYVF